MRAAEIIAHLQAWASSSSGPFLRESILQRCVVSEIRSLGIEASPQNRIGGSIIDALVPCSDGPSLLIELKRTGDWRGVAMAVWQLHQASALLAAQTPPVTVLRMLICGSPFSDELMPGFLAHNGIVWAAIGKRIE